MVKILLDTDIGTDVDDAVALAYLLSHPQCELLGVTTVTGEAEKRASLASVLCRAAGKDIPIYPGAHQPLEGEQRQPVAQQAAALPRWPHQVDFPCGQAVAFLRQEIRRNPGEVFLVTIAPLTNIGQLFITDPEIPALLGGLVMMAGIFQDRQRVEWNAAGDPMATEAVYRASARLHRSLGLDVTQKVMLAAEEVRQQFTAPLLQPVRDFAEIWFAGFFPSITFHDPLTAATVFEPDLCTYEAGTVSVDRGVMPGRTLFEPGGPGSPHQIARSVDPQRYFEHFFAVVNGSYTEGKV